MGGWIQTAGRIVTRRATVCHEMAWLQEDHEWPGLAAIGKIETMRESPERTTVETRYYIMSAPISPERVQHALRAHWAIENCLHWVLDVTMNEDRQRTPCAASSSAPHGTTTSS